MTVRTVGIPDANQSGATVIVNALPDPGQAMRSASLPIAMSIEDVAALAPLSTQPVSGTVGISGTVPVSGTFFQTTQPISASALPLPSGAATATGVAAVVTALGSPLQAGGTVVTATPSLTACTDRSGTITAGGTAQVLAAANPSRVFLKGQNISTSDLWINETGGTAAVNAAGSYVIGARGTFSISTSRSISIYGATTGQAFTATEG